MCEELLAKLYTAINLLPANHAYLKTLFNKHMSYSKLVHSNLTLKHHRISNNEIKAIT